MDCAVAYAKRRAKVEIKACSQANSIAKVHSQKHEAWLIDEVLDEHVYFINFKTIFNDSTEIKHTNIFKNSTNDV